MKLLHLDFHGKIFRRKNLPLGNACLQTIVVKSVSFHKRSEVKNLHLIV